MIFHKDRLLSLTNINGLINTQNPQGKFFADFITTNEHVDY